MRFFERLWILLVIVLCSNSFARSAFASDVPPAQFSAALTLREPVCVGGNGSWDSAFNWWCSCGPHTCREWDDETTSGSGYATGCATENGILSGWQTLVYVVYYCSHIEY